jgi:hypothetical protein
VIEELAAMVSQIVRVRNHPSVATVGTFTASRKTLIGVPGTPATETGETVLPSPGHSAQL